MPGILSRQAAYDHDLSHSRYQSPRSGLRPRLVLATMLVAAVGLVMVYTATEAPCSRRDNPHYYVKKQALFVVLGSHHGRVRSFRLQTVRTFAMLLYALSILSLLGSWQWEPRPGLATLVQRRRGADHPRSSP